MAPGEPLFLLLVAYKWFLVAPHAAALGTRGRRISKRAAPSAADPEKRTYQTSMERATSKKLCDQECCSVVDFLNRGGCSFSVAPGEPD